MGLFQERRVLDHVDSPGDEGRARVLLTASKVGGSSGRLNWGL